MKPSKYSFSEKFNKKQDLLSEGVPVTVQGKSIRVSFGLNFVIVDFKRINYQISLITKWLMNFQVSKSIQETRSGSLNHNNSLETIFATSKLLKWR